MHCAPLVPDRQCIILKSMVPFGQVGKAYSGPREALRLTGKFVLNQLLSSKDASNLATSPFVTALRQEVRTATNSTPQHAATIMLKHTALAICDTM